MKLLDRLFNRRGEASKSSLEEAMRNVQSSTDELREKVVETMLASNTLDESTARLRSILYETSRRAHNNGSIVMNTRPEG